MAYENAIAKRNWVGSRKAAVLRGHTRGIVIRPEQMLDLIRDTYPQSPVPSDALFQAVGVDREKNLIYFHFYSIISPQISCAAMQPQLLLDFLKGHAEGAIPLDAEMVGISVHNDLTLMRLDARSTKFDAIPNDATPVIEIRYEGGELLVGALNKQGSRDYTKNAIVGDSRDIFI